MPLPIYKEMSIYTTQELQSMNSAQPICTTSLQYVYPSLLLMPEDYLCCFVSNEVTLRDFYDQVRNYRFSYH
jgi:hypothetical protein